MRPSQELEEQQDNEARATLERRIAELERIVMAQSGMLQEIAEAAGFQLGDTYSAAAIITRLRSWKEVTTQ